MIRAFLAAVAMAALACVPSASAQGADPFGPSREGAIACFDVNPAARTCAAIAGYRFQDGQIFSDVILFIQGEPQIILYGTTTVYERAGMVCERVERDVVYSARITMDGETAPPQVSQQILDIIWGAVANINELCSRYTANGDTVAVAIFADGVERPDLADTFIWVRPDAGYTLAPAAHTSET